MKEEIGPADQLTLDEFLELEERYFKARSKAHRLIRKLKREGVPRKKLAQVLGKSEVTISQITKGVKKNF